MAKKIKFESFKYRFLIATQNQGFISEIDNQPSWNDFVRALGFKYDKGSVIISWDFSKPGNISFSLVEPKFYLRGDTDKEIASQLTFGLLQSEDPIKLQNDKYFKEAVMSVAESAGYENKEKSKSQLDLRLQTEREFHDAWADSEDVEKINVRASNEVCTAPEMRYIVKRLGDIKGKKLLDVGCGLGEASVYFALLGADVTSSDLSQGMLDATSRLANANNVTVNQHVASAEDMQLSLSDKFDIIYAGNLLHHVNIEETIARIKPHLMPEGVFVSWDPLAYNPAINVYRKMAMDVRTPDEHPLKYSDIQMFKKHFDVVEMKYFWLTTLVIFIIMALAQRRNPNKERFWKTVVEEGDKWKLLYKPLEKIDSYLLRFIPPLRLLCWNVVIVAKSPK